jgi:hypothetical protein
MERKRKAQKKFKTYTEITEKWAMIYVSIKIATVDAWVGSGLVSAHQGDDPVFDPHIPSYSTKY